MRIESIKAEPDRGGRFWIMLEDGSRIPLYRQTIEEFGLYAGKDLTDEQWAQLQSSASAMSAKMRAVRIVAASAVSKKDLQHRLVQKGEDPQQAAQAVAWMEELRLVDDAETARQVISRCIAKGYGVLFSIFFLAISMVAGARSSIAVLPAFSTAVKNKVLNFAPGTSDIP